MYVIFKDDASVILTEKSENSKIHEELTWSYRNLEDVILSLERNEGKSFVLKGENTEKMWGEFCNRFKMIEAAGGIVINEKEEFLMIFRHDTWDLPKGKIDRGETIEEAALREVREECGFTSLSLGEQVQNTYHIYEHNERQILKVTYWYLMYSDQKLLTPQLEEGITDLRWKSASDMKKVFENTYPNIKILISSLNLGTVD
jgi:8-oxo-dGTP pyrophosphatase MutT (NUDIX family)